MLFELDRLREIAEKKGDLSVAVRTLDSAVRSLSLLAVAAPPSEHTYRVQLHFSNRDPVEEQRMLSASEPQPEPLEDTEW